MTGPYRPPPDVDDQPTPPKKPVWALIVLLVSSIAFLGAPYLMLPWWVSCGLALVIAGAVLRINRPRPG